jgi:hypothetical protein
MPINWEFLIGMGVLMLTSLGVTIPLHLHISRQIDAIHEEMKRFHGKLERIDAEFKAHIMSHQDERKKK